ncbi:putative phage tail protein [Klebsiella quasipneumoniae]|uniref:phage tail tip fiber protein n=1 Tax=Klebsiella quasipneumoniae TaxID=1463165 RepID=UPI000DE7AB9D|nr:phage tail protein [Klebsiella quasipneumoniae]SSG19089.1 putative phage tail protein [Klebsiella quasipneumoniae]SSH50329.1 putative phage tail protein [Klebsiella quasipneumoniae]
MEQFKKRKLPEIIAGAGGKKSSGSSRTPVEADDTVNSNVKVSILDLLGEGVIGGLKDGAKSIFLNDLPLQNSDDTYNHSGVTWWFRDGSQDQSIIEGFDYTETPKTIGLQVKKTSAVTMAVDSDSADRFRVILKFPSLKSVDKKTGDTSGTSVTYKFQVSSAGGAFVDVAPEGESSGTVTLTAKKAGVYYRSYMLNLPKPGSKYQVRVVRVTDDNKDTTYLANDIYVDTVGEIINTNMNYPNSALVGLRVNSEQFGSSMPSRSYLISGMKIRVPSNYDEVTNEYRGTWDGSFKLLSSSNPAWILYDLVTNKRYGLGEFVRESMFDLGQLYQIGRYCDALVDDGFGGKEKRFAINTQITTLQDAYRCVQDIAGAFRGMVYWAGGMVHVTQDSPSDPIAIYSNSNVIDGRFSYKGSARKDRPSVALITYNNKEDNYKQNIEYVEDLEAIKRYGIRKTESVAFGCTSRGMAHRVGLWTLYTGRMESDVITFQTGMDSAFLVPGDVILIHDKFRAGRRNSGRVVASTANSITLDATVDMTKAGTITFINAEGRMISRDILESGVVSKVTFKDAVNEADRPVADGVWVISQSDLKPLQARVVGVTQGEDGVGSTITCIQNNPSKYAAIDDGAVLIPQNTTVLDPTFSKPENLKITEGTYLSSPGNLNVSLTATWEGKSAEYWVSWRRSDAGNVSNWQTAKVNEEQFEVKPVAESGKYDFQVYGVSVSGRKTEILSATYQVLGTMTPPGAPSSLTAVGDYRQIILGWSNPSSVDLDHIQIYASKTNDVTKATLLAKSTTTNFTHSGLEDSVTWYYWIRSANKRGMTSDWSSKLGTSAMTRDVLSFLQNKITNSELAKDLLADIDSKAVAAEVDASIEDAKSEATAQVEAAKKEASGALDAAKTTLSDAIKQEATDRAKAVADEAKMRAQAVASEVDARTKAISDEAIARADAITKESDTRTKAMADEVTARNKAVADEAAARATAISDSVAVEATARAKAIADSASSLSDKIEKEVTDRVKAVSDLDTKTANAISSESSSRIAAISDEAKTRADAILQEKNSRQAEIKNVSAQMQTANESLAQQISQVAAGTGEQFDSLKIWYFDTNNEGWTEDDGSSVPMNVTSDGWLKSANSTSSCRSPNNMAIDANAYRFIKLRIKKVGNPVWAGKLYWIGASEQGWSDSRSISFDEPEYDANGIATLSLHDIDWRSSTTIRRLRLDFLKGQNDANYLLIDWIAVGRPTPGAGMAALQDEKTARTNADAAEAASRSTLATQLRGSYDGTDITKLSSGLIFQEQQARVTADKVEATARQSLETKVNDSVSSINKSLDTLNTKDQAMASDITGLKSSLGDKADASAVQTLKATVEQQGSKISTQGQSITKLQGDLNTTNTNVGKKADQTAMTALQGTVTQQGKDIAAANSSISTLKSSLDTTNDAVAKKADATAVSDLSSRVSATEGSVSSQGDSIVQLNNSLSNALADSDASAKTPNNLIVNPSFERGMDGYIGVSSLSTVVAIQIPHVGTKALKIDPGSSVSPGQYIDFVKGRTYEIGVWVKQVSGTTDNGQGNNKLRVGNSAGAPVFEVPFVNLTVDWTKVSKRWKATETGSLPVTLSNYLTAGNRYFDDFYVIDVTDTVNIDASASAISSLQSTVTQQGKDISSQSTSIAGLNNSLNTTNENVAKKADSSAVQTLQNTVTQQGKDISAANSDITNLKGSLDATNDKVATKADASAMSDLASRVSQNEKGIATQSDSLTKLSNKVSSIDVGGVNLITNGDMSAAPVSLLSTTTSFKSFDRTVTADIRGMSVVTPRSITLSVWFKELSSGFGTTKPFTSVVIGKSAAGDNWGVRFYASNGSVSQKGDMFVWTGTINLKAGDTLFNDPTTIRFILEDKTQKTGAIFYRVKLENGNIATDWSASPDEVKSGLDANASALNALTTRVASTEGNVESQGNSITSLKNDLATTNANVSKKADSSAVATIQSTVTQQGKDIASSASDISSLKNSLATTDGNVAKKADASALQTLQNTVTQQGKDLTSVGNRATALENSLKTTNDNVATKADASALSSLQNTVTQQGKDVAANTSNITALSNQVVNGKQDTWARRIYKCQLANAGTEPTFSDIQGLSPVFMDEVADAARMDFSGAGSYVVAHYKAMVRVAADTTISVSPGSRVFDDSGAVYVNSVRQAAALSGTAVLNFTLSAGWNTVEFLVNQWTGNAYVNLGFKLGDKVAELYSGLGVSSLSSALNSISSNVSKVGDQVSSNSTAITSLKNGLSDTNSTVAKKADASALQTLQNTVTQQGKDIASQSDSVTNLSNALSNVSIGGVNLIKNSGDMAGWSGKTNEIFRGNAVISATTKAGSSYRDLKEITLDAPVDNAEYVYSFFAKGGENGQSMTAYFYNPNSTTSGVSSQGVSDGSVDGRMSFTLTTEWVRYWVKWKQKPGTGSKRIILARIQASSTKDQTVSITSPKLEVGNMPTEWSPAPSDMASSNDLSSLKTTVDANSSSIQSVTSRVQKTEDSISTQNTAITKLQGDLSSTNNLVSTKADSTALQTLSGRVDKTESSISTQNDAITKLNSSLDTTNKAVAKKAEQSSLDTLSGRVSSTENGITAANSSITSLNAAIRAENASSGDLITNPTFDPQYAQMGFTVVTTDTDGVPANCPFRYAAKLASRDHHPNFNTIVATLGDVFEISVLVACGAGNADFNLYLGTANGPTGGVGGPLYNGGNTKATSTWTRVTWKFTVSQAMVDKGYIRPFLQINQSSPFGTIWYVTDWHMRNITAASKAQDTANATSKAVDSLTSTVNQQGSDISSIGSRTTSLENGLSTTNANVAKKADSSALQTLQNSVTQQGNDISGQGSRVTSLENNLTAGANLIPNPAMLNGAQGWAGSATTVDGYAAVVSSSGWSPSSSYFQVTPGDIIDLSLMSQSEGAASISWGLRFDGPGLSNFCLYAPALTFAAGEKKSVSAAITVPAGATKAMFQASAKATSARTVYNIIATRRDAGTKANSSAIDTLNSTVKTQGDTLSSIGSRTTSLENGLSSANSALSLKADASALSSLTNTVTQQGKDLDAAEANIIAANTSITSMQASLTRRTVFTVTAKGNGNSANHGLFDESGKSLFTPGRSYALITFKANSDGSTAIDTSKTYDVFGSANNGKAMSDDIAALANGVYVCVMTYDEPSGQRNSIASALELLGGTTEVINSLPYRGAYILLGRKGMKAGDGLELRAPTGGDSSAFISTSVEFVNGVMMGLGAAGGVMMKADANASAITTLQNTVKQQGDTIASSSSAITSLQNDMRTVNDNVSKKADASALQTLQNTVTQQGKDISTQSASLTQLNNSLSATNASIDASGKIPGNLIVNSSFERDKDGYTGWSSIASVIAASVPHSGSKILKLAAGGSVLVGQDVTYLKGRTYKIGAWAKQDSGTVIQAADNTKFRIADSTGLLASSVYGPFTSNWQEISFTWRPGKDVTAATQITAYLSAGAMYFDDFYVIDITDRVDLDATVSAVSGLTTRVSNAEGNISSQSDSITTLNNGLSTLNKTVSTKADATALSSLQNTVTQQGKDISSASGSITSLQSSLNTLKVQSNPWIDGTFETYDNNQQLGGSTAIVTTDFKNSGSKCLKVTRPANTSGNSDKMIGPYSAVRQSAKYRVEFWAMMPASEAPPSGWTVVVGLHSINKDGGNDWQGIAFDEAGLGGRDQWVKFTGVVKVSPSVTRSHVWISTRGQSGSNTPGYAVYIDDVVITDITDAADAQATADANATAISSLQTKVSDIDGKVTAQTSQLSSMQSKVDSSSSKVDQMSKTLSDSQSTQASLNTSLQSQIDAQASANIKNQADLNSAATSIATIKSTQSTQATQLSAIAKQQTDMTASLDNQSASIQTLQESVANNDSLKSTWMVKMETNSAGQKYAAGIALGVDGKSQQSQFLVQADRFALINTSNGNTTTPFVIDNGVTYMNAAYIKDGAITNAKIGGEIRSDNFVDGSQGWRVGKDGSSQFHNVVVRGHVEANSGSFRGAVYATDGWFQGTVYANRIEGDIGSFAINIAQHRTRKVPKATWQWFELARFRRQSFDQVINIRGGLLQTDSITIDGGAKLRAGMSYSSGADGGLNPGFLSHAMLLRATGATSGGGSMEIGIELMYETGGWDRLLTAQGEMNVDNMSFVVPAGSGDAVLRYGCYLDRNGQMVLTILSRFDAFSARNNNVIRGSSTP